LKPKKERENFNNQKKNDPNKIGIYFNKELRCFFFYFLTVVIDRVLLFVGHKKGWQCAADTLKERHKRSFSSHSLSVSFIWFHILDKKKDTQKKLYSVAHWPIKERKNTLRSLSLFFKPNPSAVDRYKWYYNLFLLSDINII
jgi:hypothetical protein